jgi:phosphoribosyl-ATP pyrophosphohydrolase
MPDSVTRLYNAALACRHDDPSTSRTARLLRSGRSKMAKKLAEEAVEVVLDSMLGDRDAVVKESADLIYHLVVLWIASGIRPEDVWKEMDRRERLLGIAEKVPKKVFDDRRGARSSRSKAAVCASGGDRSVQSPAAWSRQRRGKSGFGCAVSARWP